ncbi:ABC transporter permease subunit [Virgibacillus necropolis]|uniref:ABC transporter permease n=1 Tax=Virgibacillus necropolis TaxID=163877 RepID=A0A221MHM7_9BACI|nr:ABC transporter permease subunit [Virgibacillus necropolis]ASN07144.1 ABC transporter permease [Virgibacillus necropolis]
MNGSLFVTMMKNNAKTVCSFTFGSMFYLVLIIWLYPYIADSKVFDTMFETLPEGYMKAFGLHAGISSLSGFVAGEYYGLLFIIILLIFCVTTATQLIARLVDRGSMAYLLASGLSRMKIALTQASVILICLTVIITLTTLTGVIGAELFIEENNFATGSFIKLNIVTYLLFFVISGYCFLFSCLFNDEKRALAISGALSFIFFAVDMLAKVSDKLDWLQYFTVFSLFDATSIAEGNVDILPISISLGSAGILLYALAIIIFKKKDLPL